MAEVASGATTRAPYRLKLHHMECCNCRHGCNCQFVGTPNEGKCEFMVGFQVIEGRYGDIDMGGVRFVAAAMYPGAIHEGRGRAAVFVDENARQEQFDALTKILTGQAGGMPWEALAGTIETLEGAFRVPIEMKVDGRRSSYRVPDVLEVRMTPIKDAMSGNEKEVHIVYPQGGFFWNDGDMCTTETMRIAHGGVRFEHPGRYSAYAIANWTNQS